MYILMFIDPAHMYGKIEHNFKRLQLFESDICIKSY